MDVGGAASLAVARRAGSLAHAAPLEREVELRELDRLSAATASGSGGLVLIEGAAGIGKTTLLRELRVQAELAGIAVLEARGSELEHQFGFGVVRQLFAPKVARLSASEREGVMVGAAGLAGVVLAGPQSAAPGPGGDSREAALHGLYWLCANLAEREPLLVAIDDAHWADRPSLAFVEYVARRLDGLGVLVALCARTREPGAEVDPLRAVARAVEGAVLHPAALSLAAVRSLVHEALGPGVEDDVSIACHEASGGNPFLLRELLAALGERVQVGSELRAGDVPRTEAQGIAALVAGRLARLGGATPALARALAVLGDGAELRHLAGFAQVPVEVAGAAADALAAAGILASGRPLSFLHPLLQSAVYGEFGESERAQAHARAARLLADAGESPVMVASHLLATDPVDDRWAVEKLREAARTSRTRGAPEVAVPYLTRALAEPPPDEVLAEVLHELGTAETLAGDAAGIEHLEGALEITPPGRPYAVVARSLAQSLTAHWRQEEAVRVLDAAIAQLPAAERELALELEAEAATAGRLDPSTYPRTVERLRRFAGKVAGETPGERALLANLAFQQLLEGGSARDAGTLARRALEGGLLDEQTSASATFYDALWGAIVADEYELAERYCDAGLADARRRGSLRDVTYTLFFRSHLGYRLGRVAEAEADARGSVEAALEGGYPAASIATRFLLEALIERGELDAAADALDQAGGGVDEIPDTFVTNQLLYGRAQLRLATGDLDGGIADLLTLGRHEERWHGRNPSVYPYRSSIAVALGRRGESEEARRLAREELELATAWGTPRSIGIALRAVGLVEGGERGAALLREAVATVDPSGARLEHARALVDLGAALRRAGARAEARDRLKAGMDLAHRCGARALAERAHEELVAAGARPRRLAVSGLDSLTASERRVAQLAVDGLTNKQIAQALFVTARTVEMHLGNVYRKLGISSRNDLPQALLHAN